MCMSFGFSVILFHFFHSRTSQRDESIEMCEPMNPQSKSERPRFFVK